MPTVESEKYVLTYEALTKVFWKENFLYEKEDYNEILFLREHSHQKC